MLGQGFTERTLIGEFRQNCGAAIATIGGNGQKLVGQKSCGAFAVDKATAAKRAVRIRDMLGHHLAKFRICDEPLGEIAGFFIVPA